MKKFCVILIVVISFITASAQTYHITTAEVHDRDTLPTFRLDEILVLPKKEFKNIDEWKEFEKLKYHTAKVYPYAQIAVKIYHEMQVELEEMNKRKAKKRYVNEKEKELREQFEAEIRNLSRTQGNILIKLVNRDTDNNCFQIIKDMKGPFTAFFWNMAGKMYDQDLKEDYIAEENPDLEYIIRMIDNEQLPVKSLPLAKANGN